MGSKCMCPDPKLQTKKYYFVVEEAGQKPLATSMVKQKSKIKLEFTLENCQENHRYQINSTFIESYSSPFTSENVLFKSNKLNQLNSITFNSRLICDYLFEKTQTLIINLMKDSNIVGSKNITLGNIVGSPNSSYKTDIGDNTYIVISAESCDSDSNSYIEVDFKVDSNNVDLNKIKNLISYGIYSNNRKIYYSESISRRGEFDIVKIPVSLLKDGFTVIFLNAWQETIGTRYEPNIENFKNPSSQLYLNLIDDRKLLFYIYNKSRLIKNYDFIDYLRNGVTIKLTIGIDYTNSNKDPRDPLSLHYLGGQNNYEKAINACGKVVSYYEHNQSFPVYGFGAIIKGQNEPNFCFNINFQNNPEIYTIDGVIREYRNSFNNLILYGPTYFSPLIIKAIERIKIENDPLKYHILLIMTDGIIDDMQQATDALVEASFLPLSVIIIGIGNDDFTKMIELDGDDNPLTNSKGVKRMRDLVQFVPFNKYKYDPNKLAEQVLEEVPRQIIEYYTMNNIDPDNLQQARINSSALNSVPMQSNIYNSINNMRNNNTNIKNSSIYY